MRKNTLIFITTLFCFCLTGCSGSQVLNTSFFSGQSNLPKEGAPASLLENPEYWQGSPQIIWAKIQQVPYNKLLENSVITDTNAAAWIKLAIISKRDSTDTTQLVQNLMAWRSAYPSHPGNQLFAENNSLLNLLTQTRPKHVALLLPLEGPYGALGNKVKDGYLNAYFTDLAKTAQQQVINFYDTNQNPNIATLYQEAVAKGADIIIGPLTKENVKALTAIGTYSRPTLALNYTDLWYGTLPANLYQFGLSPLDEAKQMADKASQTHHTRALLIAPNDDWGKSVTATLRARWAANGGVIIDTYNFGPTSDLTQDIAKFLHIDVKADHDKTRDATKNTKQALESQRRQDFDVVFLLAAPDKARTLVPLLRYYYVTDIPIYATSVTYAGKPMPQKDNDLNGVFFCDIPSILQMTNATDNARLYAVGQDAYFISHELPRFAALPNFPAYAATGALTLTPQHQFYRRLAWAQFHEGHP